MPKAKKPNEQIDERQQRIDEFTLDLQRTRADFENYRKRVDADLATTRQSGRISAIMQLLPAIDTVERAVEHLPAPDSSVEVWQKWAEGIKGLTKNLDKALSALELQRIDASPGSDFNPGLHEAIMTEEGGGEREVIVEELQAGYRLGETILRHSLVKVGHQ